jgi:RNase P/RNase MRP subunit POP5
MRSMMQYLLRSAMLLGLVHGVVACAVNSYGIVRVPRQYDEMCTAALTAIQGARRARVALFWLTTCGW